MYRRNAHAPVVRRTRHRWPAVEAASGCGEKRRAEAAPARTRGDTTRRWRPDTALKRRGHQHAAAIWAMPCLVKVLTLGMPLRSRGMRRRKLAVGNYEEGLAAQVEII